MGGGRGAAFLSSPVIQTLLMLPLRTRDGQQVIKGELHQSLSGRGCMATRVHHGHPCGQIQSCRDLCNNISEILPETVSLWEIVTSKL